MTSSLAPAGTSRSPRSGTPASPVVPNWAGRDLEDDLADGAAVGDVAQRGGAPRRARSVAPMCGTARPRGEQRRAARPRCAATRRGACVAKSRNWKPRICTPFSSTRLSGIRGIDARRVADGHEAAAPAQRAQRRLGEVAADRIDDDVGAAGQRARATLRADRPARWSTRWCAPLRRRRRRASRPTTPPRSPTRRARTPSCTAARPTPPPAPSTTSSSPGCTAATDRSTWYAVRCATPNAAASAVVDAVGDGRHRRRGRRTTSSANAPTSAVPNTRSPTAGVDHVVGRPRRPRRRTRCRGRTAAAR